MKGQTFSTDAIVAVAIFMVVILLFFYISGRSSESKKIDVYADDAAKIPDLFVQSKNESFNFIKDNKVNTEKLDNLSKMSYDQIKSELGVRNDFCIHFEDENGNVVFIDIARNVSGIGRCG